MFGPLTAKDSFLELHKAQCETEADMKSTWKESNISLQLIILDPSVLMFESSGLNLKF